MTTEYKKTKKPNSYNLVTSVNILYTQILTTIIHYVFNYEVLIYGFTAKSHFKTLSNFLRIYTGTSHICPSFSLCADTDTSPLKFRRLHISAKLISTILNNLSLLTHQTSRQHNQAGIAESEITFLYSHLNTELL